MTPVRKWLKIILVNLLFIGVSLALLEGIFGGWFTAPSFNQLNLLKNVSFHFDASKLYPSQKPQITYTRDAYALRGPYTDLGSIDILTMGGSTTDQRYLDNEDTWQEALRNEFTKNGRPLTIVNAGADGHTSLGHLKSFENWFPELPGLQPKAILVYIGINDIFADPNSSYDDLTGQNTLKGKIKSASALYKLYQKIRGTYQAMIHFPLSHRKINFAEKEWTGKAAVQNHEALMAERLSLYEKRLQLITEQIRALGAKPIFVTQTTHAFKEENGQLVGIKDVFDFDGHSLNGVDLGLLFKLLNQKTMEVCRQEQGICLDLAKEIQFDESDFYDYLHNTPQGAQKIGHYLYEQLKEKI